MATLSPFVSGVFAPHYQATISAPAEVVFELLTDISTYPDWNPFVPRIELPNKEQVTRMHVGLKMLFMVQLRFLGYKIPASNPEKVVLLETPDNVVNPPPAAGSATSELEDTTQPGVTTASTGPRIWKVEWAEDSGRIWFMRGRRFNEVEELTDGSGCVYRTSEVLDGPGAYLVKWTVGTGVQLGIEDWAKGLKERAEEIHRNSAAQRR